MNHTIISWCLVVAAASIGFGPSALVADDAKSGVQTLEWPDLMPEDWVPANPWDTLDESTIENLIEGSEDEKELMKQFEEARSSSPVVDELNGKQVRLPGYVLPLDFENRQVSEFLLVPYFGACIHVPPPPSNQIVYVKTDSPLSLEGLYDPVWVTGTLRTEAHYNDMGDAGYSMSAADVAPYE